MFIYIFQHDLHIYILCFFLRALRRFSEFPDNLCRRYHMLRYDVLVVLILFLVIGTNLRHRVNILEISELCWVVFVSHAVIVSPLEGYSLLILLWKDMNDKRNAGKK
jgi:hypothetical protein